MSRFEHMVNATQLSCVPIWTLGCYATVLCLSIWAHGNGECYATVLRNCLASLDLNTWCVLRNCLVSRFEHLDATQLSCEHMVNATQLSYATVLRLSIWTHGVCYATVLCPDLNTWMLRNCLVSLDLNTWWMLRNCLTQLSCVSRFEHMVCATQLSCVSRFEHMDATQLSCVSRFEHMVNATQLSCASISTHGCYATVLCLSIFRKTQHWFDAKTALRMRNLCCNLHFFHHFTLEWFECTVQLWHVHMISVLEFFLSFYLF